MIQPSLYNLVFQRLKIQASSSKSSQVSGRLRAIRTQALGSPRKTSFPQRWSQAPELQRDQASEPNICLPEPLEHKRPAQEVLYSPVGLTSASPGQRCPPPASRIHSCALWLPLFPSLPPGIALPGPWPAPVYTCARREMEESRCRWPDWQKVAKKRSAYLLQLAGVGICGPGELLGQWERLRHQRQSPRQGDTVTRSQPGQYRLGKEGNLTIR